MMECELTCGFGRLGGIRGHGDAHVVLGKFVTGEHLRPWKTERLHDGGAAVPHRLAQPPARINGSFQAHGRKKRTEENLGARVAVFVHQWHPAAGLLFHLGHGLVFQQIGQQHLVVAYVVTEPHVVRNVHALGGFAIAATAVVRVRFPAEVLVLGRSACGHERHCHNEADHPPNAFRSRPHACYNMYIYTCNNKATQ